MQDLGRQYLTLESELDQVWKDVASKGSFIGGENVAGFESEFAAYVGAKFCVGVGNGTDALEIALTALSLPPKSEVIVPANSFFATAEAVTNAGHQVVFADVDEDYLMDMEDVAKKITRRTRAIVPVHLYGRPVDILGLREVIGRQKIAIVEDCAQAHGSEINGGNVGSLGDVAAFSFYPGKTLGAFGDAGAVVTNDESIAKQSRLVANHGRVEKYTHIAVGRNSRLDALQAGILRVKLRHLDSWVVRRNGVAEKYRGLLGGVAGVILPRGFDNGMHSYHLFVIRVPRRDKVMRAMLDSGIEVGLHYPEPIHLAAPYRARLGKNVAPRATQYSKEILSLPMNDSMNHAEVETVADALKSALLVSSS